MDLAPGTFIDNKAFPGGVCNDFVLEIIITGVQIGVEVVFYKAHPVGVPGAYDDHRLHYCRVPKLKAMIIPG